MGPSGWADGPHPDRADHGSFADLPDPDGNVFVLQERGHAAASRHDRGGSRTPPGRCRSGQVSFCFMTMSTTSAAAKATLRYGSSSCGENDTT